MLRYLISTAFGVFKDEGIKGVIRETLKFLSLYGSPKNLLRYKVARALLNGNSVIRDVQGSRMTLQLKSGGIHADLFMYGYREPEATRVMKEIMEPDWTVIDIGANIGYYALMEARNCKKVYAIEPGTDNYPVLLDNININSYNNIIPYRTAIGDHNGTIKFSLNPAAPNWNRVTVNGSNNSNVIEVPVRKLDSLWEDQGRPIVDLLRMDVEGYELKILRGATEMIGACKPSMFLEVHRDHIKSYGGSVRDLFALLAEYDYSITHSFVVGRPSYTGKLRNLITDAEKMRVLADKGIASHIFFASKEV